MGFYVAFHRNAWGGMKRFMTAAGSGILAAVVVYVVLQCVSLSLPYMKVGVQKLAGTRFSYELHLLYDDAYRLGRVNIKESSTDRLFEVQEPSSPDGENEEPIVQATEPQTVKPIHRTDLDDPDISNGRFNRWKNGLEIFCASPILGTSPRGVYAFAKDHCPETYVAKYSYSISNSVIELLACSGLAGAIAMLGFLLASAIHIVKNAVTKTFDQETMILTGTIVLIVCASVLESDLFFLLTISGVLFWFILGTLNGNAQGKMPLSFRLIDKMTKRKNK
jgi:hypothetical protein